MVRWSPAVVADEREESTDERALLDTILATFAGLDLRAVAVTAALVVVAIAVLLGVSAQDAAAGSRWCC